jgi:hypothetical protein
LLTSRGTEESGRGLVVISAETLTNLLHAAGFEDVQITPWWRVFNRVFARKPGLLAPAGEMNFVDVLTCPKCGKVGSFAQTRNSLNCNACNQKIELDAHGIWLYR